MSTAVVWLRRDLRIADNPALARAAREHDAVAPVFCFESGLTQGRHASPSRNAYLVAALRDLDGSLKRAGARLLLREGDPAREIAALASAASAATVYVNEDHTAHARWRDRHVGDALRAAGVELVGCGGVTCADVTAIETGQGGPYRVFTPFQRAWERAPRREVEPGPRRLKLPGGLPTGRAPSLSSLHVDAAARRRAEAAGAGERAARRRMSGYMRRLSDYAELRELPGADATSRLSAPLHFGCLSALELEAGLRERRSAGAKALRRQLCWRDFYLQLMHHHPANARHEHQRRFRGIRWRSSGRDLEAWKQGRTGYAMVDAGMRQLVEQGWIHNRVRLTVASFLTKDLLIDWREGESHFMRHLIDGDEASNNGNWQWTASVGADAQPYHRIFNPVRQQRRFDPDGAYVRRWVPELARLPDRWLAEPWQAPDDVQRRAGCVIGRDYPAPIVDHARARDDALARFAAGGRPADPGS